MKVHFIIYAIILIIIGQTIAQEKYLKEFETIIDSLDYENKLVYSIDDRNVVVEKVKIDKTIQNNIRRSKHEVIYTSNTITEL